MTFSEHKDGEAPAFEYIKDDEERKKRYQALRKAGATSQEFAKIKHKLLNKFREFKIPFMVSPYEADSQLAYLANTDISEEKKELGRLIDLVISSDSDCVPLGIPRVLAKVSMDHKEDNCYGVLYEKTDIPNLPDDYNFRGFTEGAIACACILSGCDYLKNLPQMGIAKARQVVEKSFRPWVIAKDRSALPAPLATLHHNLSGTSMMAKLPPVERRLFWNGFLRSLLMFRHPVVFDPLTQEHIIVDREDPELTCYEPYANMVEDDDVVQGICGEMLPDVVAKGVVEGWINPKRLTLYKDDTFGEFVEGDTPEDIKKGYDEWVAGGGLDKVMATRKERDEERGAELEKIIKEGGEDERRELEEYQKGEDKREERRRKAGGGDRPKKKKIYAYNNAQMEIKERFVKLYEKVAPEKILKVDKIMSKYKDNLLDAIEAAEEKYGVGGAGDADEKELEVKGEETEEKVEDSEEVEESEELVSPNKRKAADGIESSKLKSPKLTSPKLTSPKKTSPKKSPAKESYKPPPPQDPIDSTDDEGVSPMKPPPRNTSPKKEDASELDKENTPEEQSPVETPPSKLVPLFDANNFPKPGWSRPKASAKIRKVEKGDDDWLSSDEEVDQVSKQIFASTVTTTTTATLYNFPAQDHGIANGLDSDTDSDDSDPALLLGRKKKASEKPPKEIDVVKGNAAKGGSSADSGGGWMKNDKTAKKTKNITMEHFAPPSKGNGSKRQRLDWNAELTDTVLKGLKKHDHLRKGAVPGMPVFRALLSDPEYAHELRDLNEERLKNKVKNLTKEGSDKIFW